jgi:dTDP-4-dehydrorhamnose 3,5-epimerase
VGILSEIILDDRILNEKAEIISERLPGVIIEKNRINIDDRGALISLIRADDAFAIDKIDEVYVVLNHSKGIVRAFHGHIELIDWFSIIQGTAKFALFDARKKIEGKNNDFFGKLNEITLSDKHVSTLTVPPGVYHGWMSLQDNTILVSIANNVYDHAKPDEHRVPPDSWGYKWEIKFR